MSSTPWSQTIEMTEGLFSLDPSENAWYNANEVYAMYCSSDVWSGNGTSNYADPNAQQWQFRGKQIMLTLINVLWESYNLNTATQVIIYFLNILISCINSCRFYLVVVVQVDKELL